MRNESAFSKSPSKADDIVIPTPGAHDDQSAVELHNLAEAASKFTKNAAEEHAKLMLQGVNTDGLFIFPASDNFLNAVSFVEEDDAEQEESKLVWRNETTKIINLSVMIENDVDMYNTYLSEVPKST